MSEFIIYQALKGNTYRATSDYVTISSGVETPLILLRNTSATTKIVLANTRFGFKTETSFSEARLYLNPTVTADGTSIDVKNLLASGAASSVAESFKEPTTSDFGDLVFINRQSTDGRSKGVDKILCLDEGAECLVTIKVDGVGDKEVHAGFYWLEFD